MKSKKDLYWLPHYTIDKNKVVFLNKYDMGIKVNNQFVMYIENGIITKDLREVLNSETIRQLLLCGIIIPWDGKKNRQSKNKKGKILVIQPHSDDIALSCSGSIQHFMDKEDMDVELLTIFSCQKYKDSPWSKYFELDDSTYEHIRKLEDKLLSIYFGCNLSNLNFKDASLRSKVSVISKSGLLRQDRHIKELLKDQLSELFSSINPEKIILPFGIGFHRDHLAVYYACIELLKEISFSGEVYLYEDYPYCNKDRYTYFSRINDVCKEEKLLPVYIDIQDYLMSKSVTVNFYRSQFVDLTLKQIQEETTNNALSVTYEGKLHDRIQNKGIMYAERIWRVEEVACSDGA